MLGILNMKNWIIHLPRTPQIDNWTHAGKMGDISGQTANFAWNVNGKTMLCVFIDCKDLVVTFGALLSSKLEHYYGQLSLLYFQLQREQSLFIPKPGDISWEVQLKGTCELYHFRGNPKHFLASSSKAQESKRTDYMFPTVTP